MRIKLLTNTMLSAPIGGFHPGICSMASAPPNEGGGGNNMAENSNTNGSGNQETNNTGQDFNAESFWDDPEPDVSNPPRSGESAGNDSTGSGSPPNNQSDLGAAIQQQVTGFKAPDFFSREMMEAIGEGKYEEVNAALNKGFQSAVEKSLAVNVQIIQQVAGALMNRVQGMIDSHSTRKDNYSALRSEIPSASDPRVGPIIEGIYDRALTLSKGDAKKAVNMTKQMMKAMLTQTGRDVDLNVAPVSGDSDLVQSSAPKIDWLEALNQAPQ